MISVIYIEEFSKKNMKILQNVILIVANKDNVNINVIKKIIKLF
jgi:hypothetical protein